MSDSTFPSSDTTTLNNLVEQPGSGLLLPPPASARNTTINKSINFQCINICAPFDTVDLERILDERDRASWRDIVKLYPGRY